MQSALDGFSSSLARVRHLHGLHSAFETALTSAVDLSDILRAEWVMGVSALDRFIHDLTLLGMLECHSGIRIKPPAFYRFQVPIAVSVQMSAPNSTLRALENEIRLRHSILSFQHPDKIADAIRLFSSVALWDSVGSVLDVSPKDVKTTLGLIVDRRNKIAHEADIDPSFPNQRWPINAAMVSATLDDIERIGRAVFASTR